VEYLLALDSGVAAVALHVFPVLWAYMQALQNNPGAALVWWVRLRVRPTRERRSQ